MVENLFTDIFEFKFITFNKKCKKVSSTENELTLAVSTDTCREFTDVC